MATMAVVSLIKGDLAGKGTWEDCKKEMQQKGFIQSVLNYDPDLITQKLEDAITKNFTKTDDWDIQKIYRASSAAGPLAEWTESIFHFASILRQIGPLRKEVQTLEEEQRRNVQTLEEEQR